MGWTMVERFWDFSVRTYGVSGVSQACLALQDERGVDVNMLLYCIWIGATRGVFNEQLYRAAMDYSHDWAAHVVRPLRAARTWMKSEGCRREGAPAESCMSVRKRIKAVELEAEKLQQDALESFAMVDTWGLGRPSSSKRKSCNKVVGERGWRSALQSRLQWIKTANPKRIVR